MYLEDTLERIRVEVDGVERWVEDQRDPAWKRESRRYFLPWGGRFSITDEQAAEYRRQREERY